MKILDDPNLAWGFLKSGTIQQLGYLNTYPAKYEILLNRHAFHSELKIFLSCTTLPYNDSLSYFEFGIAQLHQRIHILFLVAIVLGKMNYYAEAETLIHLHSHLIVHKKEWKKFEFILQDNFNSKWVSHFKKILILWKNCPPFKEEIKEKYKGLDYHILDQNILYEQEFLLKADISYKLVETIKPIRLKWQESIKFDYGYIKVPFFFEKHKYKQLLDFKPLLQILKKDFSSRETQILYQIKRRIQALVGALFLKNDDRFLIIAQKILKKTQKSSRKPQELENIRDFFDKAKVIFYDINKFKPSWKKDGIQLIKKIEAIKELKKFISNKNINLTELDSWELVKVYDKYLLIEKISRLCKEWLKKKTQKDYSLIPLNFVLDQYISSEKQKLLRNMSKFKFEDFYKKSPVHFLKNSQTLGRNTRKRSLTESGQWNLKKTFHRKRTSSDETALKNMEQMNDLSPKSSDESGDLSEMSSKSDYSDFSTSPKGEFFDFEDFPRKEEVINKEKSPRFRGAPGLTPRKNSAQIKQKHQSAPLPIPTPLINIEKIEKECISLEAHTIKILGPCTLKAKECLFHVH